MTAVRARHVAPGQRIPGRLVDASTGGIAFAPAAPLAIGDVVRMDGGATLVVVHLAPREGIGQVAGCRLLAGEVRQAA